VLSQVKLFIYLPIFLYYSGSASASVSERALISDELRQQREPLTSEQLQPLYVISEDFDGALQIVQPSSKREGFATTPDVTWADIGALDVSDPTTIFHH
jgi:SpoVK/Ycf46/Vps4 family AAA+-type ATPase